jgi:putative ATP-dependent endonuclease of OLD family
MVGWCPAVTAWRPIEVRGQAVAAHIKLLRIQRFRGIHALTWRPNSGANVILGGGNVGKTTILEAIGLLLSPSNGYTLSDSDYLAREVEQEFVIEAVISLAGGEVNQQGAMAWPWEWDGQEAALPMVDGDAGGLVRPPVYKVRVRGTGDLELIYEIVQPDDSCTTFSTIVRRAIGLVRLSGDDRNDRDLRLVQGSGLDRLLGDRGLRARLGREIAAETVDHHLDEGANARLSALDHLFRQRSLPTELGLAFTGSAGLSINALVGLTAEKQGVPLPLAMWGSGTRRLAALAIADSLQEGHPVTLVDELERGLEPYRQRQLAKTITAAPGQSFITTHSASVLSAAEGAAIWYVDASGQIGTLPTAKIARQQAKDPEAFLARLTVVVEGATEVGFVSALLDRHLPGWRDRGVHVADGAGNDSVLDLLEALGLGGLRFAGFADNEGTHPGRWTALRDRLGALLFQWPNGNLEQNVIPLFQRDQLHALIIDPLHERTGMRLRSLAERLQIADASYEAIAGTAGDQLSSVIIQAATGSVPDRLRDAAPADRNPYKGHASVWFKSVDGGRELAEKVHGMGVWQAALQARLQPFLIAVVEAQQDAGPPAGAG